MDYLSTHSNTSKVAEGVTFTLRRMTKRRRDQLEYLQASASVKVRNLMEKFIPLDEEKQAAIQQLRAKAGPDPKEQDRSVASGYPWLPREKWNQWCDLRQEIGHIEATELEPIALRYVVLEIKGLSIDGQPVTTVDRLVESGEDDLYAELLAAVKRETGLLPEEIKNSGSPSISAAVDGGENQTGNAANVVTVTQITNADVASITGQGCATVPITP